ncbi:MAG TPA: DUF2970 domain-containing protein [Pseudomonas sp.]|nr:DUF2970 domain-containing protein [Pseudomonas sp.]
MSEQQPQPSHTPGKQRLSWRQMLQSVLAAAFGVQSNRNRLRDFSHGKPSHFIVLGLLFTGLFVLLVYGVVRLVLGLSGVA